MEQAYAFMERQLAHPVAECGQPMAWLPAAADAAGVEVTFSDLPHADGLARCFFLREGLIGSFIDLAREINERNWVLHVEDAFRSRAMQTGLGRMPNTFGAVLRRVRWELGGAAPDPEFLFRRLAVLIAQTPKVGTHMSGSAIDVSIYRRDDGAEVDRGRPYLEMSERTPMASPFIPADCVANRRQITEVFERHGFVAYPYEFWHYSQGDVVGLLLAGSDEPARYGPIDFDPDTGHISPIENPTERLASVDEIRDQIAAALDSDDAS
jgi:D-alanyl-D-alanine dipeptidase